MEQTQQAILNIVDQLGDDPFQKWQNSLLTTTMDCLAAAGEQITAAAVLKHLQSQCRDIVLPENANPQLIEAWSRIRDWPSEHYQKIAACFYPYLHQLIHQEAGELIAQLNENASMVVQPKCR